MTVTAIFDYLRAMSEKNASDLYLTVDSQAMLRVDDRLEAISDEPLSDDDLQAMLSEVLTNRQRREFETNMELNLALDMGEIGRYRINVMRQRQHPGMVIRRIISQIPSFEQLRLPQTLGKLALDKRGLILVTGITGSGKSTTLAAMIDSRNQNTQGHIITIEDPIEYYHRHGKSIVTQREIGIDTSSYLVAIKNALRQKPDVILVGEIRDREVMEQTLTAAETGHLCLATIHTNNAYQAIERIINLFPEERHQQVRLNLAMNLRAIISQRLVAAVDGSRALATEILLNEAYVRELIQSGETQRIREVMEQNVTNGMMTFDISLFNLYINGIISEDTALAEADVAADLKMRIQQHKLSDTEGTGMDEIDTSLLSM